VKLNLGSGQNHVDNFVNVDKYGTPDVLCDLEVFPWPWEENSVDEVLMYHSLEHMGQKTETFIGIMKELYRVCSNGTIIHIAVPHPRHDSFIDDATHVRIITPELLGCFSKRINLLAQKDGSPNSPLALYHNVDFDIAGVAYALEEPYDSEYRAGKLDNAGVMVLMKKYNNVAREWRIELRVVK
jgi:hypothetical protein